MPTQQTIKNIIFDFGCVIIKADFKALSKKYSKSAEEEQFIYDNIFNSPEWTKYGLIDTGLITFEGAAQTINDRTNNSHEKLVNYVLANVQNMFIYNDDILDIIKSLKEKGYKIYLLSNISKKVFSSFRKDLEPLFDGLVLSYKIHKIKPYDGIYKYLLDTFSINPEESLFIDDNRSNVQAAKKFNLNAEKSNKNDINNIKQILSKWGCLWKNLKNIY